MKTTKDLLRQEIEELTTALKNKRDFKELKQCLKEKGIKADDLILAGFMEDEYLNQYGAIITPALEIIDFQIDLTGGKTRIVSWRSIPHARDLLDAYRAIEIGFEMAREQQKDSKNES